MQFIILQKQEVSKSVLNNFPIFLSRWTVLKYHLPKSTNSCENLEAKFAFLN